MEKVKYSDEYLYDYVEPISEEIISEEVVAEYIVDADFFLALQRVVPFSYKNVDKQILCGVLVEPTIDGKLNIVATNIYCLLAKTIDTFSVSGDSSASFVMPRQWIIKELPKLIKENGGEKKFSRIHKMKLELVEVNSRCVYKRREKNYRGTIVIENNEEVYVEEKTKKLFIGNDRNYEINCVKGRFVNWKHVIPPENENPAGLTSHTLTEALRFVGLMATENDNKVFLSIDNTENGKFSVHTRIKNKDNTQSAVVRYKNNCNYLGEDKIKVCLNWSMLHSYMKDLPPGSYVYAYFGGPNDTVLFRHKVGNETYLQVPIRKY